MKIFKIKKAFMLPIWERYFLQQFIRMFFLFLFCFYGLYMLIDYVCHTSALAHHVKIPLFEALRYYFYVFSNRAEIMLPLALLIAFIHTICTLNASHELFSLMASGFKIKLLMRPFLVFGFLCLLLLYANEQLFLPQALRKLRRIEDATKDQNHRHPSSGSTVRHVMLEDGSLLIFQDYDTAKEQFFDVYWIESINSIYRIKYLSPNQPVHKGFFVDHLVRQSTGEILQETSFRELTFPNIRFDSKNLQTSILDPESFSIFELALEAFQVSSDLNEKESKIMTAFYWKLLIPLFCLLAIIAPAPFCVKFSRQQPVFLIYTGCLFGLIACYMFLDACQVIAKRQVLSPFWALCFPFLTLFSFFGWRFSRME